MYEIQAVEFKKINITQLQSLLRIYANNDVYRMVLNYIHNMLFQQTAIRTNQLKIAVAKLYKFNFGWCHENENCNLATKTNTNGSL